MESWLFGGARVFGALETLRQATSVAAEMTMPGRIGCIAPGVHADLLVVHGDPLAELVAAAFAGGRVRLTKAYTATRLDGSIVTLSAGVFGSVDDCARRSGWRCARRWTRRWTTRRRAPPCRRSRRSSGDPASPGTLNPRGGAGWAQPGPGGALKGIRLRRAP